MDEKDKRIEKIVEYWLSQGLENEVKPLQDKLNGIISNIDKELNHLRDVNFFTLVANEQIGKAQRLLGKIKDKATAIAYEEYLKNQEKIDLNLVMGSIVKLYFLTEDFFATIGIIRKPKFLMTYIGEGEYIRYDFEAELLENTALSKLFYLNKESGSSSFGLRFNVSTVAEKMKKVIENNEKERQNAKALYKHYKRFITPYQRYENNNETGWKMNEGVAREAFERHLENLHSQFVNNENELFKECSKIESVGRRWVMYRYASGSDPYFTGPDTIYSQVKAENASLISNIETILNTAQFIVSKSWNSVEEMKKLLKTKGENEINTFSRELYENLSERVQANIEKEISKDLGLSNYNVNKNKDNISIVKIRTKRKT